MRRTYTCRGGLCSGQCIHERRLYMGRGRVGPLRKATQPAHASALPPALPSACRCSIDDACRKQQLKLGVHERALEVRALGAAAAVAAASPVVSYGGWASPSTPVARSPTLHLLPLLLCQSFQMAGEQDRPHP